jgi:hypothetical protein
MKHNVLRASLTCIALVNSSIELLLWDRGVMIQSLHKLATVTVSPSAWDTSECGRDETQIQGLPAFEPAVKSDTNVERAWLPRKRNKVVKSKGGHRCPLGRGYIFDSLGRIALKETHPTTCSHFKQMFRQIRAYSPETYNLDSVDEHTGLLRC